MEVFKIFGDDSELHLSRRDGSIAAMRRRGKELLLPARLAFSLRKEAIGRSIPAILRISSFRN